MTAIVVDPDIAHLLQRSLIYRLLGRVYHREPDEDLLANLGSKEVLSLVGRFSPQLETSALIVTDRSRIEDLAIEFCRLFIGPGPCVSPYESVVRTEPGNAGRLWGDATVEVKHFVESLGLRYSDDFHEMPDHVSVEFELMSRLLDAEAEALDAGDAATRTGARRAQEAFFSKHLDVWLPSFCDKLQAATGEPFYAAAAVLTRDFIVRESRLYAPAQGEGQGS